MKNIYNITILWWTDGFWKWLSEYIISEFQQYVSITITGRDIQKWSKVADELWVIFSSDTIWAVREADIVIYSVPISYTEKIIEKTLPYIKPWAIVSDVTSIKWFPSKAMNVRDDIIVIPTHPMFWPYISSIAGQVFVLTPENAVKNTLQYKFLKEFLEAKKAKVREETPAGHDKMMAVVQGLTHLNMFVVWETMKRLDFDIGASMDFISPIYKLMVSSVWRYLGQNPGLYADIQMYNDEIWGVHEAFLTTTKNFNDSVKNKDVEKFCSDILSAREALWVEQCEEWQAYSDKTIYLLWKQVETLRNNMWKIQKLKNIHSWEIVEWKLLDFSKNQISFVDGTLRDINHWEVL